MRDVKLRSTSTIMAAAEEAEGFLQNIEISGVINHEGGP